MTGPEAAAVRYATAGLPVFPVHGKLPLTEHGLHDATTDPAQITSWFERWPEAGVAIVTGGSQHLCAVDVDGERGRDTLAWLAGLHGSWPQTRRSRTGGGEHLLYVFPPEVQPRNTSGQLGPGLDTRGEGGYIVAPPSRHPNGSAYTWEDTSEIALAPGWLVRWFKAREQRGRRQPEPASEPAHERYVQAALEAEVARVAQAQEGQRNDTLNAAAYNLGQLVGAGLLRSSEAEAELLSASQQCGLPQAEAERTLRSGLAAGELDPRQVELHEPPPRPALRAAPEPAPKADEEPVPKGEDAGEPPELGIVTLSAFAAVEEAGASALLGTDDEALIPEDGDVMVYGDGGAGKTTLVLDLARHLAAGHDWLGIEVPRPLRVLVIENEGPRPLFRKKLARTLAHWQDTAAAERIFVLERPWGRATVAEAGWREALAHAVEEHQIDIVIAGPLTRLGMDEAGTLQQVRNFMVLVAEVRRQAGRRVAFLLAHHENKGGTVSGAWEGAGDTLLHVTSLGHGTTRVYVQKARWSSQYHGATLKLRWAEGESFVLDETPEVTDADLAELILDAIATRPGTSWTPVEKSIKGAGKDRLRPVRDRLLADRRIANVAKDESGEQVVLDHVPERHPARLYPADDPTIRHLRRGSAADAPQPAALWPETGAEGSAARARPQGAGAVEPGRSGPENASAACGAPLKSRSSRAADVSPGSTPSEEAPDERC